MKLSMIRTATLIAFGVAALCTTPANAQENSMRAHIPFAFTAGEQVLPAGTYVVRVDREFHRVRFDSTTETAVSLVRLSLATDSRSPRVQDKGVLRFTKYGDQYFLSTVWTPGETEGSRITTPKRLLEAATRQLKDSGRAPETVSISTPN